IPTIWISDQRHDDADTPIIGPDHLLEEPLQAAAGWRNLGAIRSLCSTMGQLDGAGADHPNHKQAERLHA
ncbi:hypothetical protein, partial [Puniceibacterium antarcticum]|uniref:hypothetical protein n=1 Tax=Puniceibacterium antarcticum TaxID=1206336 RepID=UPI0015D49E10